MQLWFVTNRTDKFSDDEEVPDCAVIIAENEPAARIEALAEDFIVDEIAALDMPVADGETRRTLIRY